MVNAKSVAVYKVDLVKDLQRISFEDKEVMRELGWSFSGCYWKNPFYETLHSMHRNLEMRVQKWEGNLVTPARVEMQCRLLV